jgi:hypoxanthine phosphoribosyltransferase
VADWEAPTLAAVQSELSAGAHLDVADSIAHSQRLSRLVQESGFSPDVVIGIQEGGTLPARIVADALGIEMTKIRVQRPISSVKHLPLFRLTAKYIGPYLYKFPSLLRTVERLNRIPGRLVSTVRTEPLIKDRRILVIDDFSCTGETFREAEKWLRALGAQGELIRTAALIAPPQGHRVITASGIWRTPIFYPSYVLATVPSFVCFPWSSNSRYYADYLNWKRSRSL